MINTIDVFRHDITKHRPLFHFIFRTNKTQLKKTTHINFKKKLCWYSHSLRMVLINLLIYKPTNTDQSHFDTHFLACFINVFTIISKNR